MFAFGSKDTAFVSPRLALYPHLTIFKNVLGTLLLRGWSEEKIKERIAALEKLPWLQKIFYVTVKDLDAEQKFLGALARALAPEPKKILVELPSDASENLKEIFSQITKETPVTFVPKNFGTARAPLQNVDASI